MKSDQKQHDHLGRLAYFGLLAILFLAPIALGANRTWIWLAFLAATSCLWVVIACFRWPAGLFQNRWQRFTVWALMAVVGWHQLYWVLPGISLDRYASFLQGLLSIWYLQIFMAVLVLVTSRRRMIMLLATLLTAAGIQAIVGSLVALTPNADFLGPIRTAAPGILTGTYVNRNHVAGLFELALAAGIGLMLIGAHDKLASSWRERLRNLLQSVLSWRVLVRLTMVLIVIGLVLTRSRMGNAGFFISLLICGAVALVLLRQAPRSISVLLISLLVIDLALIGTFFGVEQVVDRIRTTGQTSGQIGVEAVPLVNRKIDRLDVSRESMKLFSSRPLLGHGPGTFYIAFTQVRPPDIRLFFDHAHNDFVEFLVEIGAIGSALIVAFLATVVWNAIQCMRSSHPVKRGVGFAALMATTSLLIHGLVDFNLRIPANVAWLIALLALATRANFRGSTRQLGGIYVN